MTVEQLHDALNQLPDDLITQTDALRQVKKAKPIVWKRLLPIAACFALVLGALYITTFFQREKSVSQESMMEVQDEAMQQIAGAPETAPAAAECPAEARPEDGADREIENNGAPLAPEAEEGAGSTESPIPVTVYGYRLGAEEPDDLRIRVISTAGEWEAWLQENAGLTSAEGFENGYDEAYFDKNQLIAVVTEAGSSSIRYEIESIQRTGTGTWELTGIRYEPEWQTEDMVQQLLLVELLRMVEPEDTVVLNLETERG